MIGIIITGHGTYGSGMFSALQALIEDTDEVYYLNYDQDREYSEYHEKLNVLVDDLLTRNENVMILTDLSSGDVYNVAVEVEKNHHNVGVVSSVNLNTLLTMIASRTQITDPYELMNSAFFSCHNMHVIYDDKEYFAEEDANLV